MRWASYANPVFHLVDGFRYGVFGRADGSVAIAASLVLVLNLGLGLFCHGLLARGYKIKA